MTHRDHSAFLANVRAYVAANPDVAAYVSDHVAGGISSALSAANERAADMEVVASTLASRRYKGSDELVLSKLRKWRDRTALNWSWLIDRPETRA